MTQEAIDLVVKNVNILLSKNRIEESIDIMQKEIAPISNTLNTSIILNSGAFVDIKQRESEGILTLQEFAAQQAKIKKNLLNIMGSVPQELEVKRIMNEFSTIYTTNSEAELEKIQGPTSTLVPISWVHKAIEVSKSVCQVVRADGTKGTGWLLENGWLMTNQHVIPNAIMAETTQIVFDYEEDIHGTNRKTSKFRLDPTGAIFSPLSKLDYAYIKVKDDANSPLAKWGHLNVDVLREPQPDNLVNIIQHPLGQKKQIALTRNNVVGVDGSKLFYKTDTEKGSSGAPVFDEEWNVIALHHAGKTEEDGGLTINSKTGEKMGANEGILIKFIMEDIEKQQK